MLLGVRLQTCPVIDILFLDELLILCALIKKALYSYISIGMCGMCSDVCVHACTHVYLWKSGMGGFLDPVSPISWTRDLSR